MKLFGIEIGTFYSDQQIIEAFEPMALSIAVGMQNGSAGRVGFDSWLYLSQGKWFPKLAGVSERRLTEVLRKFSLRYQRMNDMAVLHMIQQQRGLPFSTVSDTPPHWCEWCQGAGAYRQPVSPNRLWSAILQAGGKPEFVKEAGCGAAGYTSSRIIDSSEGGVERLARVRQELEWGDTVVTEREAE